MTPIVVMCYLRQSLWHRLGTEPGEALWKEFPVHLMASHNLKAEGRRLLSYLPSFLSRILLRIPLVAEQRIRAGASLPRRWGLASPSCSWARCSTIA